MQIARFENGGFVLHRAGPGANVSAWFDADGKLLDAERKVTTSHGTYHRPLRPDGKDWLFFTRLGPAYTER